MQTMERETGFHEGVKFACEVIERALVQNPDIPMIAFKAAKEAITRSPGNDVWSRAEEIKEKS